uniref:DHX38 n=1 Tax=Echinococcus granulosus TaxID=6210 RepID=A0A068WT86_ECHGR|nr:hypothetical protein EgrG_002034700 [Echinococcus granulosus]
MNPKQLMEEEAARLEKENKRKMQRKKSRRYSATISRGDRSKTLEAEDMWLLEGAAVEEFMVGEDEHMASKEDILRLKKIRHDATQEVFDQSVHHKGEFLLSSTLRSPFCKVEVQRWSLKCPRNRSKQSKYCIAPLPLLLSAVSGAPLGQPPASVVTTKSVL